MEHRLFKKTGDEVSLLGLGNMRLPTTDGVEGGGAIDFELSKNLIDAALAGGVNYFDTAYGYHAGKSEAFVGEALVARHPRQSFFLASKLPMWLIKSREDALRILDEQLARCQTDYFDFYLFHSMCQDYMEAFESLGLYDLLKEKQAEGVIRNLGFSFHDTPEVLERLCSAHAWDFAQIQFNYLDQPINRAEEQYAVLEKHGIPCVVMEPVRGGRLADLGPESNAVLKAELPDASIASWAMRWVAAHQNVLCILSGMSNLEQLQDNLATLSNPQPLTAGQQAALEKAVAILRQYNIVPCTKCRYCMPCPSGVNIPGMLEMWNEHVFDTGNIGIRQDYAKWPITEKAHNCVACRKCEKICPQKLPIIQLMKDIHARGKAEVN